MKAIRHFITITHHKILVMQGCFRIGLYKQGLLHDMSKYSPTEFLVGCRYYKGYMSPNNAERADRGYSSAWLHHKGRNKHHLEYWIDYAVSKPGDDKTHTKMEGMKMPIRYVCEMFIDRVSASKTIRKKSTPTKVRWNTMKKRGSLHDSSRYKAMLEYLLVMLSVKGEEYTYSYIKKRF